MNWRAPTTSTIGWLALAAFVVGWVVVMLAMGCSAPKHPERAECSDATLATIEASCLAQEVERGCQDDPVTLCADLVAECEDKIDRWERCK